MRSAQTGASGRGSDAFAAKVLKQVMVNTGGNKSRSLQNVKTAAPETQQMMGAENINRRRHIMAVRGM
ncbi:hypothetical protein IC611_23230 (plasmid) [Proteus mirabilis]